MSAVLYYFHRVPVHSCGWDVALHERRECIKISQPRFKKQHRYGELFCTYAYPAPYPRVPGVPGSAKKRFLAVVMIKCSLGLAQVRRCVVRSGIEASSKKLGDLQKGEVVSV